LSDQVVALISDEHSAKLAFQDDAKTSSPDFDFDSADDFDRLFDFEVSQTGEQEETAVATEGFKVCPLLGFIDKFAQHLEDIPLLHVRNQYPSSIVSRSFRHGASPTQGDCWGHEPGCHELGVYPREIEA